MNEKGASDALRRIAAGNETGLGDLVKWLLQRSDIAERYLPLDLEEAARARASESADGGLAALLDDLTNRPDSWLLAFFPSGKSSDLVLDLPYARIGPASALFSEMPNPLGQEMPAEAGDTLAILTRHNAQGRLGAIRNAAWLQTVLGALGLAAFAHSNMVAPIVLCPVLGRAIFVDGFSGVADEVGRAALLAPELASTQQIASLLSNADAKSVVLDGTALSPADLVQQRLTLAARWFQLASSASSTADAVISLGIALEVLTGDQETIQVTDKIIRRSALFLASAAPADDRADVYFDELKRAKKLYGFRSRVAHGRYDEWNSNQSVADSERMEFHRFVFEVALGFRRHARERNMKDDKDFVTWWKRVEIEGISA